MATVADHDNCTDNHNDCPEPVLIATWAREDEFEPQTARLFTGDEYADWAETNHLADAYPWPARFYGIETTGALVDLDHHSDASPYDEDDYATVTHTWTRRAIAKPATPKPADETPPPVYALGVARRDGRA
jgi:hypothetical protein